jgi:CHAD domain-containing protein
MAQRLDEGFCVYGAGIIARHLAALRGEIEGVRQAEDIEFVHRMRVASRRLRSTLPLFQECYPKKEARSWLRQIRAITRALGAARDTDVQLEALEKFRTKNEDPRFLPGLRRLMLRLAQRRRDLQVGVMTALAELEASEVLEEMEKRLAPLLARKENVYLYTPTLYLHGYEAITTQLSEFMAFEPYVSQPERVEELHAMRIAAKRLRYTMEIFAPIYPGELKSALQAVRKVQEQLGDIHDCDVWGIFLPQFLQEEETLTRQFYGNSRGFRRMVPGIQAFLEERLAARKKTYTDFVPYWQKTVQNGTWKNLLTNIQIPFHQGEPPAPVIPSASPSEGEGSSEPAPSAIGKRSEVPRGKVPG